MPLPSIPVRYICRLTGILNNPIVNKEDYPFEIGKAIPLKSGSDIAIIATGSMVYHALECSETA